MYMSLLYNTQLRAGFTSNWNFTPGSSRVPGPKSELNKTRMGQTFHNVNFICQNVSTQTRFGVVLSSAQCLQSVYSKLKHLQLYKTPSAVYMCTFSCIPSPSSSANGNTLETKNRSVVHSHFPLGWLLSATDVVGCLQRQLIDSWPD